MSYKSTPVRDLVPLRYLIVPYLLRHPKATAAALSFVLILSLIDIGYDARWTGFGGKTLWDWLNLLVVPVVLALGGLLFTRSENRNSLAIADQHAQDASLQNYLDQMSQLIIEQDLRRAVSDADSSVSARARTLTVVGTLDANRKASLLRFLYEAGLIEREGPIVRLEDADLSGMNLYFPAKGYPRSTRLLKAALSGADLSGANLTLAVLAGSDLSGAELSEAIGRSVHLEQANLTGASLFGADLTGAWLVSARLTGANMRRVLLRGANLRGANLGNPSEDFNQDTAINDADLTRADLTGADLTRVMLVRASLIKANLTGATLTGARLQDADLTDATVTDEQLEACASLEGTVMPNGLLPDGSVPDKPQQ